MKRIVAVIAVFTASSIEAFSAETTTTGRSSGFFRRRRRHVSTCGSCNSNQSNTKNEEFGGRSTETCLRMMSVDTSGLLSLSSAVDWGTSSYTNLLDHYYYPTQSATGAIFASLGDTIAQNREIMIENEKQKQPQQRQYDPKRTMNYFLKGIGGGIMWACWFNIADVWSLELTNLALQQGDGGIVDGGVSNIERIVRTIISILLEQFLVCPIFYTLWDIPIPAILSGSPIQQVPAHIKTKLVPLLVANAKVWTFANFITYNIPLEFRVLFTSCADIVWQSMNAEITSEQIIITPPSPKQQQQPLPLLPVSREFEEADIEQTSIKTRRPSMDMLTP